MKQYSLFCICPNFCIMIFSVLISFDRRKRKYLIQQIILIVCDYTVAMPNPSTLLPMKFGTVFFIRTLNWSDFPGQIDQRLPWSAHIFWSIEYKITDYEKHKISVSLVISKRSWVRPDKKCNHLLNHEQGHYLIGALCVLEFLRRVEYKKKNSHQKFQDIVAQTFDRTIKEFLEMERQYDNETEHRLNYKMQEQWDYYITQKLGFYQKIFDKKKNKFVKLSQSPSKEK